MIVNLANSTGSIGFTIMII